LSGREDSGLYQLLIHLPKKSSIRVGKLGRFDFPSGYYVYTGSAKRGLSARIRRHLSRVKKKFWHIDYLLAKGEIVEITVFRKRNLKECELARRVARGEGAKVVAPGFGASDCGCVSHLVFFQTRRGASRFQ
jgi:Uri superfamily endonuclease